MRIVVFGEDGRGPEDNQNTRWVAALPVPRRTFFHLSSNPLTLFLSLTHKDENEAPSAAFVCSYGVLPGSKAHPHMNAAPHTVVLDLKYITLALRLDIMGAEDECGGPVYVRGG